MSKLTLAGLMLPLFLLFAPPEATSNNSAARKQTNPGKAGQSGTLQKMIVENGSVTMDLDLNRLNGISFTPLKPVTLQFAVAANSFFTILVFNDLLRGADQGTMALIPQSRNISGFPTALSAAFNRLVIEKLPAGEAFDLAVRDGNSGFTFFYIEGHQYDYDADAQLLGITGGNLRISRAFANALGRSSDADGLVGKISIGATMQPIEVQTIVNGETKSDVMPPLHDVAGEATPTLVRGPDVIVVEL